MNPDPHDVTFQFNHIQFSPTDDESESVELTPGNPSENDDVADEDEDEDLESQKFLPEKGDVDGGDGDVDGEDDDVTFNLSQVQIDANEDLKSPEYADVDGEKADVDGEEADVDGEGDDVAFNFRHLKPQQIIPENSPENDDVEDEDDDVTFGSSQAQINDDDEGDDVTDDEDDADVDDADEDADVADEDEDAEVADEEDDDVEGEEFTFMSINSDSSITELTEKTVFPLFDQSLLYNNSEDGKRINDIPVNNVFIESPRDSRSPSSSSSSTTTLTAISDSNEMNIKSNSTGFSKLWRFRDNNNINRCNSDGRDAFVFLNPKTEGKGKGKVVIEGEGKMAVKKKVKKANVSAHEVYLKKAKGGGEEEKRKSYLPYRPGLMGFFTNVNGGLSKNVHPF